MIRLGYRARIRLGWTMVLVGAFSVPVVNGIISAAGYEWRWWGQLLQLTVCWGVAIGGYRLLENTRARLRAVERAIFQ